MVRAVFDLNQGSTFLTLIKGAVKVAKCCKMQLLLVQRYL